MTDREKAIAILTSHLMYCKRVHTRDDVINALTYAIESINVDRAYDLAYEKQRVRIRNDEM